MYGDFNNEIFGCVRVCTSGYLGLIGVWRFELEI